MRNQCFPKTIKTGHLLPVLKSFDDKQPKKKQTDKLIKIHQQCFEAESLF